MSLNFVQKLIAPKIILSMYMSLAFVMKAFFRDSISKNYFIRIRVKILIVESFYVSADMMNAKVTLVDMRISTLYCIFCRVQQNVYFVNFWNFPLSWLNYIFRFKSIIQSARIKLLQLQNKHSAECNLLSY